jgi:hypothetical protein
MMDERDFWGIMAIVGALAALGIIQSRLLRQHDEQIRYLMDNTVTRETTETP